MPSKDTHFKLGVPRPRYSIVKQQQTVRSSIKRCEICGAEYHPMILTQRWCPTCAPNKRARRILGRYGLAYPQYKQLLDANNGMCFICQKRKSSVVDHDHQTGRVRGLLCWHCNTALHLVENPEALARALEYLSDSPLKRGN